MPCEKGQGAGCVMVTFVFLLGEPVFGSLSNCVSVPGWFCHCSVVHDLMHISKLHSTPLSFLFAQRQQ